GAALRILADLHKKRDDFAAAKTALAEVVTVRTKLYGVDHWRTIDARWELTDLDQWTKLDGAQRQALDQAKQLNQQAIKLYGAGKYAEAVVPCQQALEIRKKVLGQAHPSYATSLNNLALLYQSQGDYAKAEPLYRRAVGVLKKALGETHPDYATSLNNLALLYWSQGDYIKAEPLY